MRSNIEMLEDIYTEFIHPQHQNEHIHIACPRVPSAMGGRIGGRWESIRGARPKWEGCVLRGNESKVL